LVVQRRALGVLRQRVLEVVGDRLRQGRRVHALVVVALQAAAGGVGDPFRLRLGGHGSLFSVKGSASGTGTTVPTSASLTGWVPSPALMAAMLPTTTHANFSGCRCSCATRLRSSVVSFAILSRYVT